MIATETYQRPNRANLAVYYAERSIVYARRNQPNTASSYARAAAHHALELVGRYGRKRKNEFGAGSRRKGKVGVDYTIPGECACVMA